MRARREREKHDMRIAILEAATNIIIEEGYDKLSMRKIADAIEYTPTTLYNYYKDKAQIIDGISKELYMKVLSNIKTIFQNKNLPPDRQLELSFKAFINTMTQNAEMGRAVMQSGTKTIFGPSPETQPDSDNGILLLKDFLQEGQRQSIFRKLDENVPWMLVTALLGFCMNAIENQLYLNEDWESLVDTFIEILLMGIMPLK